MTLLRTRTAVVATLLLLATVGAAVEAGGPKCKEAGSAAVIARNPEPAAVSLAPAPVDGGLDLEIRVFNLRIEFPILKSLPLRPGRHIVLSFFAPADDRRE
jgi:hypothetical protein